MHLPQAHRTVRKSPGHRYECVRSFACIYFRNVSQRRKMLNTFVLDPAARINALGLSLLTHTFHVCFAHIRASRTYFAYNLQHTHVLCCSPAACQPELRVCIRSCSQAALSQRSRHTADAGRWIDFVYGGGGLCYCLSSVRRGIRAHGVLRVRHAFQCTYMCSHNAKRHVREIICCGAFPLHNNVWRIQVLDDWLLACIHRIHYMQT